MKELKETMNWTSSTEISSTGRTNAHSIGASDGCRKIRHPGIGAGLSVSGDQVKKEVKHQLNRRLQDRHRCIQHTMFQTYHVPETMSSEQKRSLQHRLNRWCVGARRRSNDVSKGNDYKMIKSHRLNRHHSIGSTDGCQLSCRSVREANG